MKAFQCDRCHEFYNEKIIVDVELHNEKYHNVIIDHNAGWRYESMDLCPSCNNSLVEWLKGKEGEQNE